MPSCKLEVDVDSYVQKIRHEHLDLDMMEDPEVDPNLSPEERKEKADKWYQARIKLLDNHERDALGEIRRAMECRFLSPGYISDARHRVSLVYRELREQSQRRYKSAVEGIPIGS